MFLIAEFHIKENYGISYGAHVFDISLEAGNVSHLGNIFFFAESGL